MASVNPPEEKCPGCYGPDFMFHDTKLCKQVLSGQKYETGGLCSCHASYATALAARQMVGSPLLGTVQWPHLPGCQLWQSPDAHERRSDIQAAWSQVEAGRKPNYGKAIPEEDEIAARHRQNVLEDAPKYGH